MIEFIQHFGIHFSLHLQGKYGGKEKGVDALVGRWESERDVVTAKHEHVTKKMEKMMNQSLLKICYPLLLTKHNIGYSYLCTSCPNLGFLWCSSLSSRKFRNCASDYAITTSFQILSYSS